MRKSGWLMVLVAGLLSVTAGCQRLNYQKTFTLTPLIVQQIDFSEPAYAQKLAVTIQPTTGSVSAYLVKSADAERVERALQSDKEPPASLLLASRVSRGAAEEYTFEATVPAKTAYTLLLKGGSKPTEVKVSVIGR